MEQSRTNTCGELRIGDVGREVTLAGYYENMRKVSKNLGFLVLRDFYGTTQVVIETEEMMDKLAGINTESTLQVVGKVRERSSKNPELPTGEIEVVPTDIIVLGKCRYNELPFEINRSKEADENARLILDAFIYQVAKDIGSRAAVLEGKVDAIILTGGIAYGNRVTDAIAKYVDWIAPVIVYPGEDELLALAQGGLRVLNGEEEAKDY